MAVLKIPQSTQQAKAGGNISGIDTTLPLNLARQQGAAISSVGKAVMVTVLNLPSPGFCIC